MMVLFALVFALAPYGNAQRDEYTILQARYGTAARNVDVTPRLKELARQNATFRLQNSTFGIDPDPGHVKVLRIYTRARNGQPRMFEFAEKSIVDGTIFSGWGGGNWGGGYNGGWGGGPVGPPPAVGPPVDQYTILQARYGTAARNVDVTPRLKELARQNATFRLQNSTFGIDPDPGHVKVLRIYTRARNGQPRMFEFAEKSIVDGTIFSGWGSGNWGHGGWTGGWGK